MANNVGVIRNPIKVDIAGKKDGLEAASSEHALSILEKHNSALTSSNKDDLVEGVTERYIMPRAKYR